MTTVLADPVEFAAVLGITYVANDPVQTLLLEAASDIARNYCNRAFELYIADEVITVDGSGTPDLLLPDPPVLAVSAVSTTEVGHDPVDLDITTDIAISVASGILRRLNGTWPRGWGNISVAYTHGYVELPPDLQMAVIQIGARLYATSGGQGIVQSEGIGTYNVTYATLNAQQQGPELATLDRYRLAGYG